MSKPIDLIFKDYKPQEGYCVSTRYGGCGRKLKEDEFVDEESRKEYSISFLCQTCQDEVFNEEPIDV